MDIIMQEVSTERYIDIPTDIRIDRLWHPRRWCAPSAWRKPWHPAKILQARGVSPVGSHKPNTAVAQAYYNKISGITKLTTETGAGQWGSALAMACNFFDIECKVYMVKVSYQLKPGRRSVMQLFGASVTASPSDETDSGRAILAEDPESPGSLGIAISEAVEVALKRDDTKYSLGSVLNHVLMHQTVIGEEVIKQLDLAGVSEPDVVIGCVGGGSNLAGWRPLFRQNVRTAPRRAWSRRADGLPHHDQGDLCL